MRYARIHAGWKITDTLRCIWLLKILQNITFFYSFPCWFGVCECPFDVCAHTSAHMCSQMCSHRQEIHKYFTLFHWGTDNPKSKIIHSSRNNSGKYATGSLSFILQWLIYISKTYKIQQISLSPYLVKWWHFLPKVHLSWRGQGHLSTVQWWETDEYWTQPGPDTQQGCYLNGWFMYHFCIVALLWQQWRQTCGHW